MKKIFYLLLLSSFWALPKLLAQTTIETGHELIMGETNFLELAHYYALHPQPVVQRAIENEDDDERPVHTGLISPSLIRFRLPTAPSGGHSAYLPVSLMPVSPIPTDSFEASRDTNSSIPPDTHGAVDSNYCVTTLNQCVRIQTRAGVIISTVLLDNFWTSVLPGGGSFDPRVHYDPYKHRWYIVAVSGAQTTQSSILIAISKTSNPTGGWWTFRVAAYAPGTYWLDYPDVGFNNKWITVTGNLFQNTGSGFLGAKVFVFNKALLLAGTSATYTAFTQATSFTICPAITYDTLQTNLFAIESWDGTAAGGGQMQLWKISGPVGTEAMSSVSFPASAGFNWQGQSNAVTGTAGADFAPQIGTANKIQCNDDRLTQVVFMNNKLWFAHNVFLPYSTTINPTRCSAQWWQIDTTGTPIQLGLLDDPTAANFYAFPCMAVNTSNDALMGFTHFSTTSHPDAAYALHLHTDPTDSLRLPFIYRHGQATYFKNYGGSRDRWGDYSGAALDPLNQTDFWTIQETSTTPANTYDTWWAYIKLCNPLATPTAAITPPTQCVGSTALYSVNSVPGATSYTWTVTGTGWSGTSLTDSINLTAGSGIATVSVVANSSCTSSTAYTFTITPLPFPTLPVVTPPATTPCAGAPSAIYTATSTGAISFNWSASGTGWAGSSTTATLNAVVGTGIGRIIVFGVNGCGNGPSDTLNVTPATVPSLPSVVLSGPIPCVGATTANYIGTSTGATSFSWTVLGTGWSGASTTATITVNLGSGTGTLICTGINTCGNSAPDTLLITTSPLPTLPIVTPPATVCTGSSVVYTAVSGGATSYNWAVTGTGWSGASTTGSITVTVGSGAGRIIVYGINSCGNGASDTINIIPSTVPSLPTVALTGAIPCVGATTANYTGTSVGATSYIWSVLGTGWSGASTTSALTVNIGTGTGTIICKGTNVCGNSAPDTVYLTPVALPGLPVVTPPATTPCASAPSAIYTATSTGAISYNWSVTGTGWSGTSLTGTLNAAVGTGIGRIIVFGVNACGNGPSDTLNVTPSTGPPLPSIALTGPIPCVGTISANYIGTSAGATSFIWSVLGTGWSGASTTANITVTLGTGSGTLICIGTNACGNSSPDTLIITPAPLPTLPVVTPPASVCTGSAVVYTAVSGGATSYNWSVTGTGWAGASTTGSITVTVGSGAGQIIVYGINSCGNGTSDTINIVPSTVPALPSVALSGPIPCVGATFANYTGTSVGATSYVWNIVGTGWSGASTLSTITVTIGTGTGTIICKGTNVCGNSAPDTVLLTPGALPGLPVVTPPATTPCAGALSATYTATSSSATTFNWSVTGTGWSGTSTTNTFNATVGTGIGQIIVFGTNACGNGPSDTLNVTPNTIPALPVVTPAGPLPCVGSATPVIYNATSTGATSFIWSVSGTGWSGASVTGSISVTFGTGIGTIVCQGTNACGSSASTTINTSAIPLPGTPALTLTGGTIPCLTATSAQYTANSTGALTYNWTVVGSGWTGISILDTLNLTIGAGTATIICSGTNACGTGSPDTVFLTPTSGVATAGSILATGGICEGSTATFVTSGITGATSYVWVVTGTGWSGTSTTTMITCTVGTAPATISVYGTSACGDGASYTLYSVVPIMLPTATFSIANHLIGIGVNDIITYTGTSSTGGTFTWNFGGGGATPGFGIGPNYVSWATTGLKTITLSVTDSGCTSVIYTDTVLVVTTTGLDDILTNKSSVNIVPNPNDGAFEIVFDEPITNAINVRLTDVQGRIVYENKYENTQNKSLYINAKNLPNAIYTATIITNERVINKKIVINR